MVIGSEITGKSPQWVKKLSVPEMPEIKSPEKPPS